MPFYTMEGTSAFAMKGEIALYMEGRYSGLDLLASILHLQSRKRTIPETKLNAFSARYEGL